MSNIKFFTELTERNNVDVLKACCKYLTHEWYRKGEILFRKGDVGTKFYVVLAGSVGIYVNTSVTFEVHNEEARLTQAKSIIELQEVRQLHSGESFGELALITNNMRAATVVCKADSHFAVLEKADFIRILGKLEQQKLEDIVEFLQSLPLFKGWRKLSTQRVSYYFTPINYIRKQVVYRSKDVPTHVYIIKSGEFEFTQDIAKSMEAIKYPKLGNKQLFHKYQVTILGKGEVFGDKEVVEGGVRMYTCTCISSGTLLIISKDVPFTQDFEKRVLIDEDRSKLLHVHAAKANIRESRIKRLISLNSGFSAAHLLLPKAPFSPPKIQVQGPPPIVETSASSTGPLLRKKSKEDWKHIMKKFARMKPAKKELAVPSVAQQRLSTVHSSLRIACIRHSSMDTMPVNSSEHTPNPNSDCSSSDFLATLDFTPKSDLSDATSDYSFSMKAKNVGRNTAIGGCHSVVKL